jgi:hypothetical protein
MTFYRHPVYFYIHVLLGFVGYLYPEVLYATVGYQLAQFVFGVRVFVFDLAIKPGNSFQHTVIKLAEVAAGYGIAMLCKASDII